MSAAPRLSETPSPLRDFLERREALREERVGDGGEEVCRLLTSTLDTAVKEIAADLDPDLTVVAVGGYGRGELSLFSDIDLLLLHDRRHLGDAASTLFRPLWDAGLRVGHSVRHIAEAAVAARSAFDIYTTLLTGRFLSGDIELFDRLHRTVASVTRARPLRRYLVSEELERRRRHPYLVMEVDVKTGRGGLRTLHGFEWERRREDMIGRFSPPPGPEEAEARRILLAVRNALHATAGRAHDTFTHELRERAARWLGVDTYELASRLVTTTQQVDRMANLRWPELLSEPAKKERRKRRSRPRRPPPGRLTVEDLASLLRGGEDGRHRLAPVLEEIVPHWRHLLTVPQLEPFHDHPVVAHLWRTVDEMQSLVGGDPHYAAIADEVGSPDLLTLAALLHDIGKGQGGDHSGVGADITREFCRRVGITGLDAQMLEDAVRHHLLLARAATRRDLDDPAVIEDVADTVGSLRLLQVLYLLTVADARATGPGVWNRWKEVLVRTLFLRVASRFGAGLPLRHGTTREEVLAAAGPERHREIAEHVDALPDEYLRSNTVTDVLWHASLVSGLANDVQLDLRPGDVADTAVVVARGRPDLRRLVTQSFAANGIDVLEARMMTRSDGVVVDTFRLRPDRRSGPVGSTQWESVEADLRAALGGDVDLGQKVAARLAAYSSVTPPPIPPNVEIEVGDGGEAVVRVQCADRIGRLAEIVAALEDAGLDIRLAKVDGRLGMAVDTFHVRRLPEGLSRAVETLMAQITSSIRP